LVVDIVVFLDCNKVAIVLQHNWMAHIKIILHCFHLSYAICLYIYVQEEISFSKVI